MSDSKWKESGNKQCCCQGYAVICERENFYGFRVSNNFSDAY